MSIQASYGFESKVMASHHRNVVQKTSDLQSYFESPRLFIQPNASWWIIVDRQFQ